MAASASKSRCLTVPKLYKVKSPIVQYPFSYTRPGVWRCLFFDGELSATFLHQFGFHIFAIVSGICGCWFYCAAVPADNLAVHLLLLAVPLLNLVRPVSVKLIPVNPPDLFGFSVILAYPLIMPLRGERKSPDNRTAGHGRAAATIPGRVN